MAIASQWGQGLQAWWQGATPATRALATGLALLMVVGLIVAASLAAGPDYQAIYHGVSGKDAAAIEGILKEHSIPMVFKDGSVSVPAKDEGNATMYIEAAGVLSKDAVPDGLDPATNISPMDGPDVIAQKTNAAKEYAMDRKLGGLDGVQSAAVSLSAGKDTSLFGQDTAPSASVILTLKPGVTLSGPQVKGIVNLVAGAVTGLTTANVKLTDQSGILLWKDPSAGGLGGDDDPTRQNAEFSANESKRIQDILDETLGPHKAIVTVTAELNFDQIHKDEVEHPVAPGGASGTIVSTRTNEEKYTGAGAPPVGGVAGAAGNLNVPSYTTGGAGGSSGGGKYTKTDTVENHDPNVAHIITQVAPGTVKRESAAALIDASIPAENIKKIQDTIASAILAQPGDPSRFVTVQQIAFDTSAQKAAATQMQSLASQALWSTVARALAVSIVAIVLLFLLTRGSRVGKPKLAMAGGGANIGLLDPLPDAEMAAILGQGGGLGADRSMDQMLDDRPLTVEDVLAEMPEPEGRPRRRMRVPSIEEQQDLKMESIRSMITAHPESVSLLLKGWMVEDEKG